MVYTESMKVWLGADHAGFKKKEEVKKWLEEGGYEVEDVGVFDEKEKVDFVDFAILVASELEEDERDRGVLFCKNGFGMVMAANRFKKVRCGFGFEMEAVKKGRNDDDINCLAVPVDYVGTEKIKEMMRAMLETDFSGEERFKRRVEKLGLTGGCENGCCEIGGEHD